MLTELKRYEENTAHEYIIKSVLHNWLVIIPFYAL